MKILGLSVLIIFTAIGCANKAAVEGTAPSFYFSHGDHPFFWHDRNIYYGIGPMTIISASYGASANGRRTILFSEETPFRSFMYPGVASQI